MVRNLQNIGLQPGSSCNEVSLGGLFDIAGQQEVSLAEPNLQHHRLVVIATRNVRRSEQHSERYRRMPIQELAVPRPFDRRSAPVGCGLDDR